MCEGGSLALPSASERGSVSRSKLAARAHRRRLKHVCSRAAACASQTRAPERASVRRRNVRSPPGVPAQSDPCCRQSCGSQTRAPDPDASRTDNLVRATLGSAPVLGRSNARQRREPGHCWAPGPADFAAAETAALRRNWARATNAKQPSRIWRRARTIAAQTTERTTRGHGCTWLPALQS